MPADPQLLVSVVTDVGVTQEPSGLAPPTFTPAPLSLISGATFFPPQHLHLPCGPGDPLRLSGPHPGPHPGGSWCCRNRSVHVHARLRRSISDPTRLKTRKLLPLPEQEPSPRVGRGTHLCPGYLPPCCAPPAAPPLSPQLGPSAPRTCRLDQRGVLKRRTIFSLFVSSHQQKHALLCSSTPVNTWFGHVISPYFLIFAGR